MLGAGGMPRRRRKRVLEEIRSPAPEGIRPVHLHPRRGPSRHASPLALLVLGALLAAGVSGLLGHPQPHRSVHRGAAAELEVEMPAVIRTGDFYETLLRVHATREVRQLQIEVPASLWREITVNSMVPAPESEHSDGERFRFDFGALGAGDSMLFKIAAQVNPRLNGRVAGRIRVLDDGRPLVEADRAMKVLP